MNIFTPAEIITNYSSSRIQRTRYPIWKLFLLGIIAGFLIGVAGAVTNMATYMMMNYASIRLLSGLLFPFGLIMIFLLGAELFTGNCLMIIPLLDKKITFYEMIKNWIIVFSGNALGAIGFAWVSVNFGQVRSTELAEYIVLVASTKTQLEFSHGVILGIFCNIFVGIAVLCAGSAKDTTGKILGTYIPICFFIICGFEHIVANMYYIPAGIFAKNQFGISSNLLSWKSFLVGNFIPVTIGNLIGGLLIGLLMWAIYSKKGE